MLKKNTFRCLVHAHRKECSPFPNAIIHSYYACQAKGRLDQIYESLGTVHRQYNFIGHTQSLNTNVRELKKKEQARKFCFFISWAF